MMEKSCSSPVRSQTPSKAGAMRRNRATSMASDPPVTAAAARDLANGGGRADQSGGGQSIASPASPSMSQPPGPTVRPAGWSAWMRRHPASPGAAFHDMDGRQGVPLKIHAPSGASMTSWRSASQARNRPAVSPSSRKAGGTDATRPTFAFSQASKSACPTPIARGASDWLSRALTRPSGRLRDSGADNSFSVPEKE